MDDILNSQITIEKYTKVYTCTDNAIDYDKFYQNIGLAVNLKHHFNAELTKSVTTASNNLTTQNSLKSCRPKEVA